MGEEWRWINDFHCYEALKSFHESTSLDYTIVSDHLITCTRTLCWDQPVLEKLLRGTVETVAATAEAELSYMKRAMLVWLACKSTLLYESACSKKFLVNQELLDKVRVLTWRAWELFFYDDRRRVIFANFVYNNLMLALVSLDDQSRDTCKELIDAHSRLLEATQIHSLHTFVENHSAISGKCLDEMLCGILKTLSMLGENMSRPFLLTIAEREPVKSGEDSSDSSTVS